MARSGGCRGILRVPHFSPKGAALTSFLYVSSTKYQYDLCIHVLLKPKKQVLTRLFLSTVFFEKNYIFGISVKF
jgi:hypothetical protein